MTNLHLLRKPDLPYPENLIMLSNNLKIALRNLQRHRTFTVINIVGLSLGMSAAIFTFLWVQNEFSYNTYHQQVKDIYRINADMRVSADDVWYWASTPLPLVDAAEKEMPEVISGASLLDNPWQPFILQHKATLLSTKAYAYVSKNWFDMFDHQFIEGSAEGFQEQLQVAILTEGFAEKLFGKTDVVGESFQKDSVQFTVQAVIENLPANAGFTYEILLPMSYYLSKPANRENETWTNYNAANFLTLRAGTNLKIIGEKLSVIAKQHNDRNDYFFTVQPLVNVYFDTQRTQNKMRTGNKQTAYTFAFIGFIILFLACVNYVSLTTAQAGSRTKEVGVRKIIGAGESQIFRLIFSESLVTTFISLVAALALVQLLMPLFNQFTENTFRLNPAHPAIWMICGSILLATLLLSGIYPALFLTGFSPGNFLKGQSLLKMKDTHFRKGLVVVQFALTVALLIGAIVIFQQQDYIRKKDLGFDRSHVFAFQLPNSNRREANVKAIKDVLQQEPGILATAASNSSIIDMDGSHSGTLNWDGKPEDFVPTVAQMSVDASFGELMQLPLADGRWFESNNLSDLNNVVLNETAVRLFQLPEPVVGQKFQFQGRAGKVVGIVKDFNYLSLRQKIEPLVLYIHPPANGYFMVKTSAGQASAAIAASGEVWAKHYPNQPFEYHFLDESFDNLYKSEQKSAGLFQVLAGLAIFISCLGLFGLAVFATAQRTKEIGVRKVLGASVPSLVGLLSMDFLKLVLFSFFIAFPTAWYFMEKWLQGFAYRVPLHWWVFALAGLLAIVIAFITISFQSVQAALANPVKALKSE
jgi:putative ABC transport system permease protein